MPRNTDIQKAAFFNELSDALKEFGDTDISAVEDYTKYLKEGQTVAQLINFSQDSNWAVYTEKGSNEGHFINIELLQGMTKRCPILAIRSHEEELSRIFPVIAKLTCFLENVNPEDVFGFQK